MADDYAKYEQECERIKADNAKLLGGFFDWLSAKGLSEDTIRRHCWNMDFYLNNFLLYEGAIEATQGTRRVGRFLGDWFIRKTTWSTPGSVRANGASLKKFYAFMCERGKISADDLDKLEMTIKEGMPDWLATVKRYNDPDVDFDDIWQR